MQRVNSHTTNITKVYNALTYQYRKTVLSLDSSI